MNPGRVEQLFATSLPAQTTGPFTRLTNITSTNALAPLNSLPSNSRRRVAFTYGAAELGGGNGDFSAEVFYNLVPVATTDSPATISVVTGASLIPVASPSPTASPSGSFSCPQRLKDDRTTNTGNGAILIAFGSKPQYWVSLMSDKL